MQLTEYPRVRQGQQTRQKLLEAITEDPTATLNDLSQKLCLSTSQIRRHRKCLKMLGLLPVFLFLISITLSVSANEIIIFDGESVGEVLVELLEGEPIDTEEMEPVEMETVEMETTEEEPDEKPE